MSNYCDRCNERVYPSGVGSPEWSVRGDGTDTLGSGMICLVPGPVLVHTVDGSRWAT